VTNQAKESNPFLRDLGTLLQSSLLVSTIHKATKGSSYVNNVHSSSVLPMPPIPITVSLSTLSKCILFKLAIESLRKCMDVLDIHNLQIVKREVSK
jgi:hypothetical protein